MWRVNAGATGRCSSPTDQATREKTLKAVHWKMPLHRKQILLGTALSVLLCASLVFSVKAEASMWTQTYGGIASDWAYSVETSDGGFAIAGATHSFATGPFSYLLPDFWLVKTDTLGNM